LKIQLVLGSGERGGQPFVEFTSWDDIVVDAEEELVETELIYGILRPLRRRLLLLVAAIQPRNLQSIYELIPHEALLQRVLLVEQVVPHEQRGAQSVIDLLQFRDELVLWAYLLRQVIGEVVVEVARWEFDDVSLVLKVFQRDQFLDFNFKQVDLIGLPELAFLLVELHLEP